MSTNVVEHPHPPFTRNPPMMRISLSALTLLGLLSSAQAQLLDEQQLRLLMEQAQGIEACMTRLDPAAMAEVRRRGERAQAGPDVVGVGTHQ
jgi:hypothetical protein